MERLREAPWTLWAYAAVSLAWALIAGSDSGKPGLLLPLSLILVVVFAGSVLLGGRLFWWVLVAFGIANIPIRIVRGADLWLLPLELGLLALLVAPISRHHVRPRPRPAPPQPAALPPGAIAADEGGADHNVVAGREVGWHIDPEEPWRMHYWSLHGAWLRSSTPTPKKLLGEWEAARSATSRGDFSLHTEG